MSLYQLVSEVTNNVHDITMMIFDYVSKPTTFTSTSSFINLLMLSAELGCKGTLTLCKDQLNKLRAKEIESITGKNVVVYKGKLSHDCDYKEIRRLNEENRTKIKKINKRFLLVLDRASLVAAKHGFIDIIIQLMYWGCKNFSNIAMIAVKNNHNSIVKLCIDRGVYNTSDVMKRAILEDNDVMVKYILNSKYYSIDFNNYRDLRGGDIYSSWYRLMSHKTTAIKIYATKKNKNSMAIIISDWFGKVYAEYREWLPK